MAADHPPDLLHTKDQCEDGGFRRTCTADPWIGDDDDIFGSEPTGEEPARSQSPDSEHRFTRVCLVAPRLQGLDSEELGSVQPG